MNQEGNIGVWGEMLDERQISMLNSLFPRFVHNTEITLRDARRWIRLSPQRCYFLRGNTSAWDTHNQGRANARKYADDGR